MPGNSQTSRLLGYPENARLLIINADDFGMCHAVNQAIIGALLEGVARSTTLMVTCPWALHAMRFLAEHPDIAFGVHLTALSDWVDYRWGPVTPREKVPSLVRKDGTFYNFDQMPYFFAQVDLNQLEMEFRAQIEVVLAAGLQPTHLDWHALRIDGREDIFEVMLRLAGEYGLALRTFYPSQIETVKRLGLPANDNGCLDSYGLDPATRADYYMELLRRLPAGLSEWAVHPGIDSPELLAIDPDVTHIRQADFDFLISRQAKDIIEKEGIILLDYRVLQNVWKKR